MAALGTVLTAVVTPFDDDLNVNEEAFVALLRHLADHGSDGAVVCGSTGEAATLDDDEHVGVVALACAERPHPGFTIIAGAGSNDTRHAVRLTERVTGAGADAVLSVTPYYVKPNRRGLLAHYGAIAQATDRPILLYNIPGRTALDIPNDLLAEIGGGADNIVGVKQANNENLAPIEGLDIYAGNDDIFARTLDMGGAGGILVASQLVGDEMRRMVDEPDQRHAIHDQLADLFKVLNVTTNPIPVKAALNLLGHDVGGLRLPLVAADEDETAAIRDALERHGLLAAAP
ncbi:MAG: 4-hydroxy-tetrahydrodipicolinate synthase [Actinobacteria bacterium]|nr:MAG: 4-hydroxy-tetrahydrodipicolinate synthase [Actinomycetota bacterium]